MKNFHRHKDKEKKGRKIKYNKSEEACKCFAPFVKLHWHDCPVARKPCPIHGNTYTENQKDPTPNVTISFHPSSKTERLFQPVKNVLANYGPDTKINFQYYSPRLYEKESNHQHIQTTTEDLKSDVFVKKTKSYVTDKTNKMKKLKQCFHSPCNSIIQKTRSQTSVRGMPKKTETSFINLEKPPDDGKYCNVDFDWFSKDKFSNKNAAEFKDSDFITVTQHDQNIVNHKIFEINTQMDQSFMNFPKQNQFVYSAVNVRQRSDAPYKGQRKPEAPGIQEAQIYNRKQTESQKSDASSSESVYATSFIFMPTEMVNSDSEVKENKKLVDKEVQVEENRSTASKEIQISPSLLEEKIKETANEKTTVSSQSQTSDSEESTLDGKKSVFTQTENINQKCSSYTETLLQDLEPSIETICNKFKADICDNCRTESKKSNKKEHKTTEIQTTSGHQFKEIIVSTEWNKKIEDRLRQTDSGTIHKYCHKVYEKKSQIIIPSRMDKKVQTSVSQQMTAFESSTGMKPSDSESSVCSEKMSKVLYGKCFSDTDLLDKKKCGCCRTEIVIPLPPSCKPSYEKKHNEQQTGPEVTELKIKRDDGPQVNNKCDKTQQTESECKEEQTSTQGETLSTTISDLSELKKIIQEFFQKTDCTCKREAAEPTKENSKNDKQRMTDKPQNRKEEKQFIDIEVQTINLPTEPTPEKPKVSFHSSVMPGEKNDESVCKYCGHNMNQEMKNASTSTEDSPKVKEKITVVDTEYSEVTKVTSIKKPPKSDSSKSPIKPVPSQKSNIPVPTHKSEKLPPKSVQQPFVDPGRYERDTSVTTNQPNQCVCDQISEPSTCSSVVQEVTATFVIDSNQENGPTSKQNIHITRSRTECSNIKNRRNDGYFFPVIIKPLWAKELLNTWKSMEKSEVQGPKRTYNNCERNTPGGKKIKSITEDTDCFVFGNPENRQNLDKSTGFVWVPTTSKTPSKETNKQSPTKLFTVKCCHLKPIKLGMDDSEVDELLQCKYCKSIKYFKKTKNESNPQLTTTHRLGEALDPEELDEVPHFTDNSDSEENEDVSLQFKSKSNTIHPLNRILYSDLAPVSKSWNALGFERNRKGFISKKNKRSNF